MTEPLAASNLRLAQLNKKSASNFAAKDRIEGSACSVYYRLYFYSQVIFI
jgi:hypothetical protein